MKHLLAQRPIELGTDYFNGIGPIGNTAQFGRTGVPTVLGTVISLIIGIITIIGGLWFMFILITGGLEVMKSGDDKNGLESARRKIMTGVIGIVIIVSGLFLAQFVGSVLGLNILSPISFLTSLR